MRLIGAIFFAMIVSTAAAADPVSPELAAKFDAAIKEEMASKTLPSVAVGIFMPGRGDYVVTRGVADLATRAPRPVDAPFRAGSITKTVIATAILQLVDEGRLSVTDPVATWFPDIPGGNAITVDDLLRMRSGIPDSWNQAMLERYYADPTMAVTVAEMVEKAFDQRAAFSPPDRKTIYTNVNYLMLQEIIEAVADRPAGEVLKDRIFAPLGMAATTLPTDTALPGPLRGYGWDAATAAYVDKTLLNPVPVGGAGAMITTMHDQKLWARALCSGTLLAPQTQASRMRAEPLDGSPDFVGYGQGVGKLGEFCGHNGTIMGFSSETWYLPAADAVFVVSVSRLDEDDQSMSLPLFLKLAKIAFPDRVSW